jgi:hypothetical protein
LSANIKALEVIKVSKLQEFDKEVISKRTALDQILSEPILELKMK